MAMQSDSFFVSRVSFRSYKHAKHNEVSFIRPLTNIPTLQFYDLLQTMRKQESLVLLPNEQCLHITIGRLSSVIEGPQDGAQKGERGFCGSCTI